MPASAQEEASEDMIFEVPMIQAYDATAANSLLLSQEDVPKTYKNDLVAMISLPNGLKLGNLPGLNRIPGKTFTH